MIDQIPKELQEHIKKDKKLALAWNKFSPSHKKEYLKWINEAKKVETRIKRVEKTIKMLLGN